MATPYKSLGIAAFIFIAALLWSLFGDVVISYYTTELPIEERNVYRIVNDIVFFSVTVYMVYMITKRQQHTLRMSEEQYRTLFVANPTPTWIFDNNDLNFVEVNDAAIAKYGFSRDEFLKMTIKDIRSPEDHERLMQLTHNLPSGINSAGIWHHIKKSGEIIIVSITSHVVKFNNRMCKMVIATDITDIVTKEQQLKDAYEKEKTLNHELEQKIEVIKNARKESNRLEKVINKIKNLVLIVNEEGFITWVNQAFVDFTGHTYNDAVGKRPKEILFGPNTDPSTIASIIEHVSKKEFCSVEIINYKKNGDEYWTQLNISPIFDHDGNFQFFISVENVITERKEKENKLRAQHKVLVDVAWSNSHELRRPLCSILSLLDLLKNNPDDNDKNQYIDLLNQCSLELDDIIKSNNNKLNEVAKTNPTLPGTQ